MVTEAWKKGKNYTGLKQVSKQELLKGEWGYPSQRHKAAFDGFSSGLGQNLGTLPSVPTARLHLHFLALHRELFICECRSSPCRWLCPTVTWKRSESISTLHGTQDKALCSTGSQQVRNQGSETSCSHPARTTTHVTFFGPIILKYLTRFKTFFLCTYSANDWQDGTCTEFLLYEQALDCLSNNNHQRVHLCSPRSLHDKSHIKYFQCLLWCMRSCTAFSAGKRRRRIRAQTSLQNWYPNVNNRPTTNSRVLQ